MATTIINPAPSSSSSDTSWMGFLVGGIVLIVLVALFIFYLLPIMRSMSGNGGVQVNLPKSVNVNVQPVK